MNNLDIKDFSVSDYKHLIPILLPSFLFITYFSWKMRQVFNIDLFDLDKFNILDGIILIMSGLYLGIVFFLISSLVLRFTITKKLSDNPSFLFYSTSSGAFLGILIIEISAFLINRIVGKEIAYILIRSYSIPVISLFMLILTLILAKIYGEKP